MCIVVVEVDILSVQGWWLPRSGITKLEQLCIYIEGKRGRVECLGFVVMVDCLVG